MYETVHDHVLAMSRSSHAPVSKSKHYKTLYSHIVLVVRQTFLPIDSAFQALARQCLQGPWQEKQACPFSTHPARSLRRCGHLLHLLAGIAQYEFDQDLNYL